MPKLTIDGRSIEVESGATVIQACEVAGIEIPHFCYHKKLPIAGNCRMCLVEMEKAPKLVAACVTPVTDGMVIKTLTDKVIAAREGVMELLLINHPLDCPVCDQGGECDLQDQAFKYGKNFTRFTEEKRAVKEKDMGPLIKTHMTRCIHCTRCIRFSVDIAGVDNIATSGRGEHMEIEYVKEAGRSELMGNLADICPVGALTTKPNAYTARSWELSRHNSIDVTDGLGSNISIDTANNEVMRVMPRLNEEINECWIGDKIRFCYDGLRYQRLDRPLIRSESGFIETTWDEAIYKIAKKIKATPPQRMAAISGPLSDCESLFAFKRLFHGLGSYNIDYNYHGYRLDATNRANYLFNTHIKNIDKAQVCLLIGANIRQYATVLNAKICKCVNYGTMKAYSIGSNQVNQNYLIDALGESPLILHEILNGKHRLCSVLEENPNTAIIVGHDALTRRDGVAILNIVHKICVKYNLIRDDWVGFNVLHGNAATVGALDIGFVPTRNGCNVSQIMHLASNGQMDLLWLLGADELNLSRNKDIFVVYQGHHGDNGAHVADIILPTSAYMEKVGTYINTEGRAQRTSAAVTPVGQAKNDVDIAVLVAKAMGLDLGLRNSSDAFEQLSHSLQALKQLDFGQRDKQIGFKDESLLIDNAPIISKQINYYMTDALCRASKIMAQCAKQVR